MAEVAAPEAVVSAVGEIIIIISVRKRGHMSRERGHMRSTVQENKEKSGSGGPRLATVRSREMEVLSTI
jgi:hypothetical protein